MKYVKKLTCILIAMMMAIGISTNALAIVDGAIIVENPQPGQTYTAYLIFLTSYNADQTAFSYVIEEDSEWLDTVKGYAGITLEHVPDQGLYTVYMNDQFNAAEFANVLKAASEGKTGKQLESGGEYHYTAGLHMGYYFVSSTTGALCNLTTAASTAIIRDKNEFYFEKTDDADSVEVGQTVHYTITGLVPETTGFSSYTYKISDTMSDGLTFNQDVAVSVDGTVLGDKYTLTNREDGTGFDLVIDVMQMKELAGTEITVTYSAKVNENAIAQMESNNAYLEYSNNPVDGSITTTTPVDQETVYNSKIVVDKYEADNKDKKLPYAVFVLMNSEGLFYKWNNTNKAVTWVENEDAATIKTTDSDGVAEFGGLADGTYRLKEVYAPDGYNLMTGPVEVVINGADATVENQAVLSQPIEVPNSTGAKLPETGGMGTTVFYAAGSVLVVGALAMLLKKKRGAGAQVK